MAEPTQAPTRTTRDPEETRDRLERWLAGRLAGVRVLSLSSPSSNGMSSESLLFDATWTESGRERTGSFVARVAPHARDVPVFPTYDLEMQFRVIRLAAKHGVPVPALRWLELDPAPLGAPFFVMDRVAGRVPPDIMPYPMGSWLSEATPRDQRQLQDETIAAIVKLHAIDPREASFLAEDGDAGAPAGALRRHVAGQRRFYDWMRGDRRYPVLDAVFDWLESSWPTDEGDTVVSWGDARIGNVLYDGFTPVAVLDWEMATLGPRALDLGWCVFLHSFFEMVAQGAGLPGMPDFMRPSDVVATYERLSGKRIGSLAWYEAYAALRHGIVMARIHARAVRFGEATWPDDLDSTIMHRSLLEKILDGTYWS